MNSVTSFKKTDILFKEYILVIVKIGTFGFLCPAAERVSFNWDDGEEYLLQII